MKVVHGSLEMLAVTADDPTQNDRQAGGPDPNVSSSAIMINRGHLIYKNRYYINILKIPKVLDSCHVVVLGPVDISTSAFT